MQRFQTKKNVFKLKNALISAVIFALIFFAFLFAISSVSNTSVKEQKDTLTGALKEGTIQTYALKGYYPENLNELLDDYSITYDKDLFLVDYTPQGENIFPDIMVIQKN